MIYAIIAIIIVIIVVAVAVVFDFVVLLFRRGIHLLKGGILCFRFLMPKTLRFYYMPCGSSLFLGIFFI